MSPAAPTGKQGDTVDEGELEVMEVEAEQTVIVKSKSFLWWQEEPGSQTHGCDWYGSLLHEHERPNRLRHGWR